MWRMNGVAGPERNTNRRGSPSAGTFQSYLSHEKITEVYYILRGSGTQVTGTMIDGKRIGAPLNRLDVVYHEAIPEIMASGGIGGSPGPDH